MNFSDFFKDPDCIFYLYETNIQLCVSTGQVRSIREIRNVYEIAPEPYKSTLTAFKNCLSGTELLQSPFRMEFSMGSLLRQYR